MPKYLLTLCILFSFAESAKAQDEFDVDAEMRELFGEEDLVEDGFEEIVEETDPSTTTESSDSVAEESPTSDEESFPSEDEFAVPTEDNIQDIQISDQGGSKVFDTGVAEQNLLAIADKLSYKISDGEWEQLKSNSGVTSTYTVQDGDWLFKISEKLFGTGHYYPKIWALNPYITNPHEIEPGMSLVFDSGAGGLPELSMGGLGGATNIPGASDWMAEKEKLQDQGIHVGYASDDMKGLLDEFQAGTNNEYKKYSPPDYDKPVVTITEEYDDSGFSTAPVLLNGDFKQGFSLNTFISPNEVEDFGEIAFAVKEGVFLRNLDRVYIKFTEAKSDIAVGDTFSIYEVSEEKVSVENSERSGFKYTILGHVKLLREVGDKFEAEVFGLHGVAQRGNRITVYTPKIAKISKKYNSQIIEAVVMDAHAGGRNHYMSGDVVYLDRGRNDGVGIGDIFGVFGREDRKTKENIDSKPVYLKAQMIVISLTEDFATALMLDGAYPINRGDLALTISEEEAVSGIRGRSALEGGANYSEGVEVETDLGEQVVQDASRLELTEDELEELDRIENQKSFIDETEKDLENLESVEKDLDDIEDILDEEDKKLIEKDLEDLEQELGSEEDELEALEKEHGKKYLDEELNEKENPFGLSENDLEEVDELLNIEIE